MAAKMLSTEKPQTRKAHPIVRTHPEIGRKLLYLGANVQTLDRFTQAEAAPLIEFLDAHSTRPEFICHVSWRPGTLVTWDNRSLRHYAIPGHNERRRMHRITIYETHRIRLRQLKICPLTPCLYPNLSYRFVRTTSAALNQPAAWKEYGKWTERTRSPLARRATTLSV